MQFTVRCEVDIAGALVSAKLVLSSDVTAEDFRALVWAEFLSVLKEHNIAPTFLPTHDIAEYTLRISHPSGAPPLQLPHPLKSQLPKPCLLSLTVGESWVDRHAMHQGETERRAAIVAVEAEEVGVLGLEMREGAEVAKGREMWNKRLLERSVALERQAVGQVQLLLQEEEHERTQFDRLLRSTKLYALHAVQLANDLTSATQVKRAMLVHARTLFSTSQLCGDSYHNGLRAAESSAQTKVDSSRLYNESMHHQHRFQLDVVHETSALRQKYRSHHATDTTQANLEAKRPVTLPSEPMAFRKTLPNSRATLRELVAAQNA